MRRFTQFICIALLALAAETTIAAPCLIVTLTGTQGGPSAYNGLAGSGTRVEADVVAIGPKLCVELPLHLVDQFEKRRLFFARGLEPGGHQPSWDN